MADVRMSSLTNYKKNLTAEMSLSSYQQTRLQKTGRIDILFFKSGNNLSFGSRRKRPAFFIREFAAPLKVRIPRCRKEKRNRQNALIRFRSVLRWCIVEAITRWTVYKGLSIYCEVRFTTVKLPTILRYAFASRIRAL